MNITKKLLKVNFDKERNGYKPEIIVVHIAQGTLQGTIEEFSSPQTQKSSHYFVAENDVIQFVEESKTAWANGEVVNPTSEIVLSRPHKNPNWYSISIEHEGIDNITDEQYQLSAELIADICERWNIPFTRRYIIGHREIKATKTCPAKIDIDKLIKMATEIYKKKIEINIQLSWIERQIVILQNAIKLLVNKFKR